LTSIRKFLYATLLALTTLNFLPTLAAAQEPAHGKFTLTHEVRWQNAIVPAGDYRFWFESDGVGGVLKLNKLNGSSAGFMFLVRDMEEAKPRDVSELVLDKTPAGSYVSAMQLPEFGMTLHFAVPSQTSEKQIARAGTAALTSGQ